MMARMSLVKCGESVSTKKGTFDKFNQSAGNVVGCLIIIVVALALVPTPT